MVEVVAEIAWKEQCALAQQLLLRPGMMLLIMMLAQYVACPRQRCVELSRAEAAATTTTAVLWWIALRGQESLLAMLILRAVE